jgi:transcriptional regulator with XRE-family HTH domain
MTREQFGARFAAARIAVGLTQQEAAGAIGVPQPRVAEYEAGKYVPPTLRLAEIVALLGLDPAILFPEWFEGR